MNESNPSNESKTEWMVLWLQVIQIKASDITAKTYIYIINRKDNKNLVKSTF